MDHYERVERSAALGLSNFFQTMVKVAPKLGNEFKMQERDKDHIDFSLDGFAFTLSWDTVQAQTIGRTVPVAEFTLCIWHTEYAFSRHHPPESIDTTLIETRDINKCISTAFLTVAKEKIRIALEDNGYAQMLEAEKNLEPV